MDRTFCNKWIYTVNHVTKCFYRSRGARTSVVSVLCWSGTKYFYGLPKSSLEHVLLLRLEDRIGEYIQGVAC